MVNDVAWKALKQELEAKNVTLVAVSKTKPVGDIQALYDLGQRDFGENYVQELVDKQPKLLPDIRWHYIGHLQTNKVKYIAPFVHLIHAVDSFKLLSEISKQAAKNDRIIDVLLQIHIADEETKFGLNELEMVEVLNQYTQAKESMQHVRICGLMGMASFSDNQEKVRKEFKKLHALYAQLKLTTFHDADYFSVCSMGMSGDYTIAVEEGSTMVRIGSMLFGAR